MKNVRGLVRLLLDLELDPDDLLALRLSPEEHGKNEAEAASLADLFFLMDKTDEMEAEKYE